MMLMVPYILLSRLISLIQASFYATQRFRVPIESTVLFCIVNPAITLLLMPTLKVYAFAISLSVGTLATVVYMDVSSRKVFGPIGWMTVHGFAVRLAASAFLMVVSMSLMKLVSGQSIGADVYQNVAWLTLSSLVGIATYLGVAFFGGLIDDAKVPLPLPAAGARAQAAGAEVPDTPETAR